MMETESQRVYGVDFSGGQTAGDKIWLASGAVIEDAVFIEACYPARELPTSASEREQCFRALSEFIEHNSGAAFGLDFPFGLPADITDFDEWETFVTAFDSVYDDPTDLNETCKRKGDSLPGGKVEYKRTTDTKTDAPFCPYNLRMVKQTYYGIGTLLGGLVGENRARILPMQSPQDDKPRLLEVCPSSTLKVQSLPREGYKGSTANHERVRRDIVDGLGEAGVVLTEEVQETAINDSEGDAVDSIVATLATAKALRSGTEVDDVGVEGHIYI